MTRILGQSRGWGRLGRTGVRSGVQGEQPEPGGWHCGPEASQMQSPQNSGLQNTRALFPRSLALQGPLV